MCDTFVDISVTTTHDATNAEVMPLRKSKRKRKSVQGETIPEDEHGSKLIRESANDSDDTT